MRVEAAEFVPAGSAPRKSSGTLSANSPEFIPSSSQFAVADPCKPESEASGHAQQLSTPAAGSAKEIVDGTGDLEAALSASGLIQNRNATPDIGGPPLEGPMGPEMYPFGYLPNAIGAAEYVAYDPLSGQPEFCVVDQEIFLTPQLLPSSPEDQERGVMRIKGRRLYWEISAGPDEFREIAQGKCLESPTFCVAGTSLRLAFFPSGETFTGEGNFAVGALCEEKTKLKFELFLNSRSSGMKVMLGKKFSCDFRQPEMDGSSRVEIGIEVHENLFYAGFM